MPSPLCLFLSTNLECKTAFLIGCSTTSQHFNLVGASILFLIAVLCIDFSSDCKAARNNDSFAVLVRRIAPATNLSVGRGSHRGYLETAFFCCVGYSSNIWRPSLSATNSQSNSFFLLCKILEQSPLGKRNDLNSSREILSHRKLYVLSP